LISGRLNGAEMARSGFQRKSSFINFQSRYYALAEAHTTYGRMGIKVWIMKGEVYGKRDLSPLGNGQENNLAEKVEILLWESNFNKGGKPDAKESF
jgi:small subunit ribosomal protein S3